MLKFKKGIIVDVYNTLLYALVNYAISTSVVKKRVRLCLVLPDYT